MTGFTYSFDPLSVIVKYYPVGSSAFEVLVGHSNDVAELALAIAEQKPGLNIDAVFVYEAAMLHDIGIFQTNCPDIFCHGREPYIKHGIIGGELLRKNKLPNHALVAERHTSSGLTREEIIAERLPLPLDRSYLPESLEEKLICYADCFYSKTHLHEKKSVETITRKMQKTWEKHGLPGEAQTIVRFEALHRIFSLDS